MTRAALLLVSVFALATSATAQTADVINEGRGLLERLRTDFVSREYDVRPLLYKPGSAKAGFDSVEQVVREVMANVGPGT